MESGARVTPPDVAGPLRLAPFRAWGFSPARVGDAASARAFAKPYRGVVDRLERWERQGHAWHDPEPALYVHEYSSGGLTVRGLVGALDVSRRGAGPAERVVLPHEGVHPEQVSDLADRMAAMAVNPAPILMVHRGPASVREVIHEVVADEPLRAFTDRIGQGHRVWAVRDGDRLDRVAAALAPARAVIADGHHRYAAYLQMQHASPGSPADRGLAMLVDQDDTPLFLGAIHRFLAGVDLDAILAAAAGCATVTELPQENALAALAPGAPVLTDGRRWALLSFGQADRTAVELLHEVVLPALPEPPVLAYHHVAEEALDHVAQAPGTAVLMPAPEFDAVRRVVATDAVLPEKATSFQPKPSLGVLMRSLRDE
ncbi:DUF1015 family protein [Nocardioides sp. GCM10027113]|uniref:DUF1015 family protein n=1 Tax=unclassified Nocardioides TaxID=2615069 RepID=UPI003617FDD8